LGELKRRQFVDEREGKGGRIACASGVKEKERKYQECSDGLASKGIITA
jgi:hypothetical protein